MDEPPERRLLLAQKGIHSKLALGLTRRVISWFWDRKESANVEHLEGYKRKQIESRGDGGRCRLEPGGAILDRENLTSYS